MPLASVVKTFKFTSAPSGASMLVDAADDTLVTPVGHTVSVTDIGYWVNMLGVPGYSSFQAWVEAVDVMAGTWVLSGPLGAAALGDDVGPWAVFGTSPFVNMSSGGQWLASDGSDFAGASDPGCCQFARSGTGGGTSVNASFRSEFAFGLSKSVITWESLGVPAGKFAVYTECRLRVKQANITGVNASTAAFHLNLVDEETWNQIVALDLSIAAVDFDSNWKTHTRGQVCVPEQYAPSDTLLCLLASLNAGSTTAGVPYVIDYRFDTIEITTYYDDQWCDHCTAMTIAPTTVTLVVGQTQNFSTNLPADFSIVEGGDSGSLSNTGDQIVTYTAGSTPGTYHLLAEDQCVAGNDATATITVVAAGDDALFQVKFKGYNAGDSLEDGDYGLPTNFLLQNPQANVVYQLEQEAVDKNNFIAKRTGFVELLRDGGESRDTTDAPVGFFMLEIVYEVGP